MSTISASTTTTTAYKVTADTTGTLVLQTGATPTTAMTIGTNQVVTFAQQPAGTFAGTGPAFSAYNSSTQTPTSGVWTKVLFDTEEFDTNSNFASSRFTPTVAGYYQLFASLNVGGANLIYNFIRIYKNGVAQKIFGSLQLTNSYIAEQYVSGSALVSANGTTDYFEIYVLTQAPSIYSGSNTTYFQGSLVRAA